MNDEMEQRIQKVIDRLNQAAPTFIDLAVSVAMSLLLSLIVGLPFVFIREINMNLVRFFPGMFGMCLALFRRGYKKGYHANSCTYQFCLKSSIQDFAISVALQSLIVVILGAHAVYVTGPTYWITDLLFPAALRSDMGGHFLHEGYDWLLMFLAAGLLYGPVLIYGEYKGSKRRKIDYQLDTQE